MPTVSVIVPVYKVEPFLPRCVESIRRQTFEDFELILVDDGSPDNCGVICEGYAQKDSRIHVIHQKNGGLSAARNTGIDWVLCNSDSEWITFVDSDDWLHPRLLEELLKAAVQNNVKISVCGYEETEGADPVVSQTPMHSELWKCEDFYAKHTVNATVAWGKLYSKECFQTVRYPVGKIHEDEYVTYRILYQYRVLAYIPMPLYAYYVNYEGITRKSWSFRRTDIWEAYEQQIAFFENCSDDALVFSRYRSYLGNIYSQLLEAQKLENVAKKKIYTRLIKKRLRNVVHRCWIRGYMKFWVDFDLLYACAPIQTKLYRLWLEIKLRWKKGK